MLRPTPGNPWGVEQYHWNTGAKENKQLNPGGPNNRQKSSGPKLHVHVSTLFDKSELPLRHCKLQDSRKRPAHFCMYQFPTLHSILMKIDSYYNMYMFFSRSQHVKILQHDKNSSPSLLVSTKCKVNNHILCFSVHVAFVRNKHCQSRREVVYFKCRVAVKKKLRL